MIIVGSLGLLILIAVVWELVYLKITTKKEVFILPKGFNGAVIIVFNQKDGIDDIKEDGKFIYRIPSSGILKIKKELAPIYKDWYYFEDAQGKRTEFYYCFPPCDEMKNNPDKVMLLDIQEEEHQMIITKLKPSHF